MRIQDFGCGTGNYTNLLQEITFPKVFDAEPSAGMRQKPLAKKEELNIKTGNHEDIPFDDSFFDFIYLTDVIYHVPELGQMFKEVKRVLKKRD